jgi:RNA polymerase sigma factor (sigma-70 family)
MHHAEQTDLFRSTGARARASGGASPAEEVLDLIARAQAGNVAAQHQLAERFEPMLRAATAHCPDPDLREELEDEIYVIFEELVLEYDAERGVNPFTYFARKLGPRAGAWLQQQYTIRARERTGSGPPSAATEEEDEREPEDRLSRLARQQAKSQGLLAEGRVEEMAVLHLSLEAALVRLSSEQRRLVALWLEQYTFPEIAKALEIDVDACKKRFHRALARLRKILERESGTGGPDSPF